MFEIAGRCLRVGVHWLDQIFDDETSSAHPANELLPAVQVFQGARLPMPASLHRRQRTLPIIRLGEQVTLPGRQNVGL